MRRVVPLALLLLASCTAQAPPHVPAAATSQDAPSDGCPADTLPRAGSATWSGTDGTEDALRCTFCSSLDWQLDSENAQTAGTLTLFATGNHGEAVTRVTFGTEKMNLHEFIAAGAEDLEAVTWTSEESAPRRVIKNGDAAAGARYQLVAGHAPNIGLDALLSTVSAGWQTSEARNAPERDALFLLDTLRCGMRD